MRKKNTVKAFLIIFLLALPILSLAVTAERISTEVAWPVSPGGTRIDDPNATLDVLIQYIYEWGISLGGIAVFAMLIWAGIEYLTSAGDPAKMSSAKKRIMSSTIGLILLLGSWLILNTINPELVKLKPLSNIWEDTTFSPIDLTGLEGSAIPCDYIIIYPKVNYEGASELKPITFSEKSNPGNQPKVEVKTLESKTKMEEAVSSSSNKEWGSAKSFIKLTEEEKESEDIVPLNQRYNDKGEQKDNGDYKEGGVCSIDLFYTTKRWWSTNACGGRLGKVQLPASDISELKYREEEITCAEISRTLPAGWRVTPAGGGGGGAF